MSDINDLISLMNATEQRGFVVHLTERNKRHDARNVDLFKALLIRKEGGIRRQIGSNAYNVLKKRLFDRLLDYLAGVVLHSEITQETSIIKQIILSRKLISYDQYKLGFKLLRKAEMAALAVNHHSLLNEIYHTLIEISHHELSENQDDLIQKLERNNILFIENERLNMVYAIVRKAFNAAEFKGDPVDLETLLRDNYKRRGISPEVGYSFQSLYQIAMLADIAGAHSRNYYAVDLFFVNQIKALQGGEGDNERMLIYHIDLLYSVSNIYFRKRRFKESLHYLRSMLEQMNRFNKKFMSERFVKHTTLRALNLNFSGDFISAREDLEALFKMKEYQDDALLAPKLVLVMVLTQQGEIIKANKLMSTFYRSDSYYEGIAGVEWVLNRRFIEIIIHIELENTYYAESRITSLIRKYKPHFEKTKNFQVLPFLKLVMLYFNQPDSASTEAFKAKAIKTIPWKENEREEDIILISFYAWLKSKMTNKPLYETTLELINKD